jgi:hypothetical protein
MKNITKKLRNIIAMFLIITVITGSVCPKKAEAIECDKTTLSLVFSGISCAVGVLTYVKGYWDGEKSVNCNCNCTCNYNYNKQETDATAKTSHKNNKEVKNETSETGREKEL